MTISEKMTAWLQALPAQRRHNARLLDRLKQAHLSLPDARCADDVIAIVRLFLDFESPVRFKKTNAYLSIALGVALFLGLVGHGLFSILALFGWLQPSIAAALTPVNTLLALVGIAIVFINYEQLKKRKRIIETLSDSLKTKYAYFSLGLHDCPVEDDFELMARSFKEFRRDRLLRWTRRKVTGHYQGDTHAFAFTYYQYKFIIRESRPGRKRDVDVIYTRCALVVDFPWVSDVMVLAESRGRGGFEKRIEIKLFSTEPDSDLSKQQLIEDYEPFETSSSDFNRRFRVRGKSKIHCARFVKPITLLTLMDIKHFNHMNIELAGQRLCLSFDSPNGLTFTSTGTLHNPQDLLDDMQQGYSMPILDRSLLLIHTLATQHDDNFSTITAAQPA